MLGMVFVRFITFCLLLTTMSVHAEASKSSVVENSTTVDAIPPVKKNTTPAAINPQSTLTKAVAEKGGVKKGSTTDKKKSSPNNEKISDLNLALPKNLDAEPSAMSLENLGQSLPDLFAPVSNDGRVSVAGGFLVEEDLELNPGSGLDKNEDKNSDDKEEETTILDEIEGAQLNFRVKID